MGLRTVHGCTSAAVDHTGSVGTTCVSGSPSLVRWPHVPSPSPLAGTGDRTWSKDWVTSLRTALTPAPQTLRAFRVHPRDMQSHMPIGAGELTLLCSTPTAAGEALWGGDEAALHQSAGCCCHASLVSPASWSSEPCGSPVGRRPFVEMCRFQTFRATNVTLMPRRIQVLVSSRTPPIPQLRAALPPRGPEPLRHPSASARAPPIVAAAPYRGLDGAASARAVSPRRNGPPIFGVEAVFAATTRRTASGAWPPPASTCSIPIGRLCA